MTIKRKIVLEDGLAAVGAVRHALGEAHPEDSFVSLSRGVRATAVRFLLEELAILAPGNSVEVRVPPFGVTQCVQGPRHTRGTPPNVVETDAYTWCALALGSMQWQDAQARASASGLRSDISDYLPLL